jgi:hypothetical protein
MTATRVTLGAIWHEQLEKFVGLAGFKPRKTSRVAAWLLQTFDQTGADWVVGRWKDNRYDAGRPLQFDRDPTRTGHN